MQKVGIIIISLAFLIFIALFSISPKQLTAEAITSSISKEYHREMILQKVEEDGLLDKAFSNQFSFIPALHKSIKSAQQSLETEAKIENWTATAIPEGVNEWDFRMGDGDVDGYVFSLSKSSSTGLPAEHSGLFFFLTIGLAILGGLFYIVPKFQKEAGIQHDGIYHQVMTRGITGKWKYLFLLVTIVGVLVSGYFKNSFLAMLSLIAALLIAGFT